MRIEAILHDSHDAGDMVARIKEKESIFLSDSNFQASHHMLLLNGLCTWRNIPNVGVHSFNNLEGED